MRSKVFLVIVLFLIWSVVSGWFYVCKIKQVCYVSPQEKGMVPSILFDFENDNPTLTDEFVTFKGNLLAKLDSTNRLQIIGLYSPEEVNETNYENLGYARAANVQRALSELSDDRIVLSSKEVALDTSYHGMMDGVEFKILVLNEYVQETSTGAVLYGIDASKITSLPAKLDAYLTYIAIENKDKYIDIIGHDYASEMESDNFEKALKDANFIREILIEKGMDATRLNATSKGGLEPIADINIMDGDTSNSRIELLINE